MFLIHKKIQLCKIENPDSGVREEEMILRIFCQTIILKRRLRKKRNTAAVWRWKLEKNRMIIKKFSDKLFFAKGQLKSGQLLVFCWVKKVKNCLWYSTRTANMKKLLRECPWKVKCFRGKKCFWVNKKYS